MKSGSSDGAGMSTVEVIREAAGGVDEVVGPGSHVEDGVARRAAGGPREDVARDSVAPGDSRSGEVAPARRRFSLRSHRALISAAVAVVVAVGGGALILAPPVSEKTDDAYVGADVTTVAPRVRGFVAEVLVRDNQT